MHRVSRRLGLIGPRTSAEDAHAILEAMCPPEDAYRFHICLIEHGRRICKAPRPRCAVCPLSDACPSAFAGLPDRPEGLSLAGSSVRGEVAGPRP